MQAVAALRAKNIAVIAPFVQKKDRLLASGQGDIQSFGKFLADKLYLTLFQIGLFHIDKLHLWQRQIHNAIGQRKKMEIFFVAAVSQTLQRGSCRT